jgi:hypothetical protein
MEGPIFTATMVVVYYYTTDDDVKRQTVPVHYK